MLSIVALSTWLESCRRQSEGWDSVKKDADVVTVEGEADKPAKLCATRCFMTSHA